MKTNKGRFIFSLVVTSFLLMGGSGPVFAQSCVNPPAGLVGWWRGQNNALDAVGLNDGILMDNATFGAGKVGQGFLLDGYADAMSLANSVDLRLQDFTIEAWIQRLDDTVVTHSTWSGSGIIFGYGSGGYALILEYDGRLTLTRVDYDNVESDIVISDLNLHHVAVTKSGNTVVFYLDGVAHPAPSYSTEFTFDSAPAVGARMDIQQDNFLGTIDEVSVYDHALSEPQIQGIFNASAAGKCPPPSCVTPPAGAVGWWRAENNALDAVGLNDGTLIGNATFGLGKVRHGFVLDGDTGAVSLDNIANLRLQDFTIEAWIRRADDTVVTHTWWSGSGIIFGYGSGGYALILEYDGRLTLTRVDYDNVESDIVISDLNLHHVAVTKSGNTVVFYLDGVAHTAPTYDTEYTFDSIPAIGTRMDILQDNFLGTIDEVSVYDHALSGSEVQGIFNSGMTGKCVPPPACRPAPPGLVSWWRAEGGATDAVGNNHGSALGTSFPPGQVGLSYLFSGNANSYVNVPDNPSLNPTTAITVECWVKRTVVGTWDPVVKKAGIGGSQDGGYTLEFVNDSIFFAVYNNGDYYGWTLSGSVPLQLGQWYHLAGVYDGTSIRLYVNGQLASSVPASGAMVPSDNPLRIGNDPANASSRFFGGQIDEVSLYNRALSATEIQTIYGLSSAGKCSPAPCTPTPSGLASWWRAEGDAIDATGNNNGTMVGVNCVSGFVGTAFNFLGTASSYINVPDSASLNPTAAITVEGWINRASIVGSWDPVIKKAGGGDSQNGGYTMEFAYDSIFFAVYNNGDYYGWTLGNAVPLQLNRWYHVAGVYDGTSVQLYINGQLANSVPASGAIVPSTNPLRIGNDPANATSRFFNGQVDEMSVYGRALTASEIQDIYNARTTGKCVQTVSVSATDASASEVGPDSGTFTVSRTGGDQSAALTVYFQMSGSAASGVDYQSVGTQVTIPAGLSSAPVTINPLSDALIEGTETAVLTLQSNGKYAVGTPDNATVNIADKPVVSVSATDPNAGEPSDPGQFTITRSGSPAASLSVLITMSGTAVNGSDYATISSPVIIPAGSASKTVALTPINDTANEPSETAILTITPDAAYKIAIASATITITDDDKPAVSVTANDPNAGEPSDTGQYTITRSGATTADLVVYFTLTGTAANGVDFTTISSPVTVLAGNPSKTITLTPVNDNIYEGIDVATLSLTDDAAYVVGTRTATVAVTDTGWNLDTDADGLPDAYELSVGLNPNSPEAPPGLPAVNKCPVP